MEKKEVIEQIDKLFVGVVYTKLPYYLWVKIKSFLEREIEVDVKKVELLLEEQGIEDILIRKSPMGDIEHLNKKELAQAIAKEFPLKTKGKK